MNAADRRGLHVVKGVKPKPESEPVPPETLLAHAVPGLIEAEATVARFRQIVSEQRRLLARKRGVAFIREERIREEFAQ